MRPAWLGAPEVDAASAAVDAAKAAADAAAATRIFTLAELAQYDGTDTSKPILLGFNGRVYDVSKGAKFYGASGGYKFFSGRDGTRGFFTGCFEVDCLIGDLTGLPAETYESGLQSWVNTYQKKYVWVGVLDERERIATPAQLEAAVAAEARNKK